MKSKGRKKAILQSLRLLIPHAPMHDFEQILTHAQAAHLREFPPSVVVWLACIAYLRHERSEYDLLRDSGYDRESAHFFTYQEINRVLTQWRASRLLDMEYAQGDDDE